MTPEEVEKMTTGLVDGSPGYYTPLKTEGGKFADQAYEAEELGPYRIAEYAALFDTPGACTHAQGCGFNPDEKILNHSHDPAEPDLGGNIMTEDTAPPAMMPDIPKLLNEALPPMFEKAFEPVLRRIEALEQNTKILNEGLARDAETKKKADFEKILNAGARVDLDTLYPEYAKDPAAWISANKEKLFNAAPAKPMVGKTLNSGVPDFDLKAEQAKIFGY
jgi:hypothetical protein